MSQARHARPRSSLNSRTAIGWHLVERSARCIWNLAIDCHRRIQGIDAPQRRRPLQQRHKIRIVQIVPSIGNRNEAPPLMAALKREPAVAMQTAQLELEVRISAIGQPRISTPLLVESSLDGDGADLPDFPVLALLVLEFAIRHGRMAKRGATWHAKGPRQPERRPAITGSMRARSAPCRGPRISYRTIAERPERRASRGLDVRS